MRRVCRKQHDEDTLLFSYSKGFSINMGSMSIHYQQRLTRRFEFQEECYEVLKRLTLSIARIGHAELRSWQQTILEFLFSSNTFVDDVRWQENAGS